MHHFSCQLHQCLMQKSPFGRPGGMLSQWPLTQHLDSHTVENTPHFNTEFFILCTEFLISNTNIITFNENPYLNSHTHRNWQCHHQADPRRQWQRCLCKIHHFKYTIPRFSTEKSSRFWYKSHQVYLRVESAAVSKSIDGKWIQARIDASELFKVHHFWWKSLRF